MIRAVTKLRSCSILFIMGTFLALIGAARAEADIGDELGNENGGDGEQHLGKTGPRQEDMMVLYGAAAFFLLLAGGIGKWAASQGHDAPQPAAAGRRTP